MDAEAVDLGPELAELVELRLAAPPVVAVAPVRAQRLHLGQGRALRPVVDRLALRPARAVKP